MGARKFSNLPAIGPVGRVLCDCGRDPAEPGLQIPGVRVHGALTLAEQADGIMANELRAAIYAVEAYLPELRGATVRFMEVKIEVFRPYVSRGGL